MGTDYQIIAGLAGQYPILDFLGVFTAKYLPYIIVLVFLLALFLTRSRYERLRVGLYWIFSMIIASGIIAPVIHYFFFRPRPFVVYGTVPLISMSEAAASFPSAHTVFFFTLATVVAFSLSKKWGTWLFVVAALIGLARVYVGVHFLLDIFGGAVIGFLVPVIVRLAFDKLWQQVPATPAPEVEEGL